MELAKAELSEKATEAGKGVASLAIGGAVAFCGLLVLLAALVLVLDTFLPSWAAALVVGVVVLGIGFVMIQSGRKKLSATSLQPTRTIETVKDDARWAKTQISQ
ncbi:phage holin family protein [Aerophototrophica crusticola]|uniref:phage holin family protein n=1 Tax=Aerophototrophica crusticola TaxID=1709002 RepID=UPI00384D8081